MSDSNQKVISTQVLIALKDAMANIYWYKKDIRKFAELTIENNAIISTINWENNTKLDSISELIDRMANRRDLYNSDLISLIRETSNMNDFSHLEILDDYDKKIKKAVLSVKKLRKQSEGYFDLIEEQTQAEKRKIRNQEIIQTKVFFNDKLLSLKSHFLGLVSSSNPQQRGYELEKLLNELFILFDLDPKSSFKISGEQIDGAFTFENTDYLLEAKWQKAQINASDLYSFGGKIQGKLKTTLGLYISLDGFSKDALQSSLPIVKAMILMDGSDLMAVLDGRITLPDLLYSKRRHAAQTGEIFYKLGG